MAKSDSFSDATSNLTPRQVKAGRALLAWTQTDLAKKAEIAVSTVADFERGEREPLPANAAAIHDALESAGIAFHDGGAVMARQGRKAKNARPADAQPLRWIDAEDLVQWASRRDGAASLPELVSRLIIASCGPSAIRFPSGESVHHPGWDGICMTDADAPFVPKGFSVWELSTQRQKIAIKADEDYSKRCIDPLSVDTSEASYVSVTLQRWAQKDEWAAAKRKDAIWKDVITIDADVLVHWIELHPAVGCWLAEKLNKRPVGIRTLTEVWEEWSLATTLPLTTEIMTVDRNEEATRVLRWLDGEPSILSLQTEAPDEAMAFLYAAIDPLPEPERLFWLSRIVVVEDENMARDLVSFASNLVIVVEGANPGLAAKLVRRGHHVLVAFGPEVGALSDIMLLRRPWRYSLEGALERAGLESAEAARLAEASGRSLAILRRLMPASPSRRPSWVGPPAGPALLAALLAGAWDRDNPVDREIIERLAGMPYDALEANLTPRAAALDGPLRRSGSIWRLGSLHDAWFLLAEQLTNGQINGLISAFLEVLSEADPAYDEPRHWRLSLDPPSRASGALRRGLTEALTMLSIYPDRATGVTDAAHRGERAVKDLLTNADERLWWSLSGDFRNLAEVAPDTFLNGLDSAIAAEPSPITSLFRSDDGPIHATEYLSDLLWALEILCWSADHVGHAAMILAKLAAMDPGRKIQNRPSGTLRRLFLPWSPQTSASASDRILLLDRILERFPQVGWQLLQGIAPKGHDSSHPSAKPRWRDFSTAQPEAITHAALYDMYMAIGDRLLLEAGSDSARWTELLDQWPNFDPPWRDRAAERLKSAVADFDEQERFAFREKLRDLIKNHEFFSTSDWAMDAAALYPLKDLFDALEPAAVGSRHAWLFRVADHLYNDASSFKEQSRKLEEKQRQAVEEIFAEMTRDEVIEYAMTIEKPIALGLAIATGSIDVQEKRSLLELSFSRDSEKARDFSHGLLIGLSRTEGEDFLRNLLTTATLDQRSSDVVLLIAFALTPSIDNWQLIEIAGLEVEQKYWQRLNVFLLADALAGSNAVYKLLQFGRGRGALQMIVRSDNKALPNELLLEVLRHPSTAHPPKEVEGMDAGLFAWHLGKAFKRLDDDLDIVEQQLAELEWLYFQALRHSDRPPILLQKALAETPEFFVTLLKALYKSSIEDELELEGEVLDHARRLARHAADLLDSWTMLPGSVGNGAIDASRLIAWVRAARKACSDASRVKMGDYRIGQMLSAAKRQPGEAWPPVAVRDVIEETANDDLEEGFAVGLFNQRGVTTRMPRDGGAQERQLVEMYRADAKACALIWPRTRAVLEKIAAHYEKEAEDQDQRAEQMDWL